MNTTRYLLYGCGQLGMMLQARFFFQWILRFADEGGTVGAASSAGATNSAGVLFAAAAVGWVFFGFRIFDGVTDPIAGAVSDAWVRRGRARRGLLWFSFTLPPLGMAMVFAPAATMSPTVRWALLCGGMLVFFVGYTFYAIPYWSLIDDYSEGDTGRRRILSNVLGAALLVATLAGFVVSGDLIEQFGYFKAALMFAVPAGLLMTLPWFAQPPSLDTSLAASKSDDELHLLASIKQAFKHQRFVAVLMIFSGSQMSFTVMTAGAVYIAKDLLGGTEGDVKFLLGPFLLVAIPCFALIPLLSQRLGWERLLVVSSIALAAVYAGTAGLGGSLVGSPMVTAAILFGLGGPMAAALLGLEGEAVTACARERGEGSTAIYFGVYNFVVKSMNGLALALTGMLASLAKGDSDNTAVRAIGGVSGCSISTIPTNTMAVRAMGIMAGALLVVGVAAYFWWRPRSPELGSPA